MPISITCKCCSTHIADGEDVLCRTCAKTECSSCGEPAKKIYCAGCAEVAFGDDCDSAEEVDRLEVADLSTAIRRGDRDEAEHILDRIASFIDGWSEAVSQGRYSPRARPGYR
jgi:hypothetical protein